MPRLERRPGGDPSAKPTMHRDKERYTRPVLTGFPNTAKHARSSARLVRLLKIPFAHDLP